MKKLFILLAVMGAAACVKENGPKTDKEPNSEYGAEEEEDWEGLYGKELTFQAVWADSTADKTRLIQWGADTPDMTVLQGNVYSGRFSPVGDGPREMAAFTGMLNKKYTVSADLRDPELFYAGIPADYGFISWADRECIHFVLPKIQTASEVGFGDKLFPAMACSANRKLSFHLVCGAIGFRVSQPGITSIVLTANDENSYLCGSINLKFVLRKISSIKCEDARILTITPPEGSFVPGKDYYAAIAPGSFKQGFTFTFIKGEEGSQADAAVKGPVSVPRASFYMLDNLDKGLSFEQNLGQQYIHFADPEVKRLLLASSESYNYKSLDTNQDGEISRQEAASVSSLGKRFWDSSIKTFDELVYFTGIKKIGSQAFLGCTSLESINLPAGLTSIGAAAFAECVSLTSMVIPKKVTSLGGEAFFGCTSLESITLPAGLTSLGGGAFSGCTALSSPVVIPNGVTTLEKSTFCDCVSLESVTLPERMTSIGYYAFAGCESLSTMVIPNTVERIGFSAFSACISLASITLPERLTEIADNLFESCFNLESVNIPEEVTRIGSRAFYHTKLTSVSFPKTVAEIGDSAFLSCYSLTSITAPSTLRRIGARAFAECGWWLDYTRPVSFTFYPSDVPIDPDIPGTIGEGAFSRSGLVAFEIPASVTSIGQGAFQSCLLESITIPDGITRLEDKVFAGSGLRSVTIPEGVTSLGKGVFSYCSQLQSVEIAGPLTCIPEESFSRCESLSSITLPDDITEIGDEAFFRCYALESIHLPSLLVTIGNRAFSECFALKSAHLPDGLTTLGDEAFYRCESLVSVYLPESLMSMGTGLFNGCFNMTTFSGKYASPDGRCLIMGNELVYFAPAGLTAYAIPKTVTRIADWTFWDNHNLETIDLPDGLTQIGNYAFASCWSLRQVLIPGSVTHLGDGAFAVSGLESIVIPNSLNQIPNSCFIGCESLSSVVIPDHVTAIGTSAFEGCVHLAQIKLPNALKTIGRAAFWSCNRLTSIDIPESVTTLTERAFACCDALSEIIVRPTAPPAGGQDMLPDNGCPIYVPAASVDAYRSAAYWSQYASRIKPLE